MIPHQEILGLKISCTLGVNLCKHASKMRTAGENLAGKHWRTFVYGRVPQKLRGLYGEEEDHYGCDNGMKTSQNRTEHHMRLIEIGNPQN